MLNFKRNKIVLHSIIIGIVLLMPILDAPSPQPTALMMLKNPFVGIDFVLHFTCVVFGYFNYFYLVPLLFYRHSRLLYFMVVLTCFVVIAFVPDVLAMLPFVPYFPNDDELQIHTLIQIRHTFFLFMLALLYGILVVSEERRRAAEREKVIAEMRYLKTQINPHFLFNTLNSIYALLIICPEEAGKSIIKMSNIMRHILNATEQQYEPLADTLDILKDYVSLQQGRFGNTIQLDFKITGTVDHLRIAPLILLPFVENAFKYGINPGQGSEIVIHIEVSGKNLNMQVVNSDFKHLNLMKGAGIGLENTRSRLNLLYANRYKLEIIKSNGKFHVALSLELN